MINFFSSNESRDICLVCSRGFQLKRLPPLHLLCATCSKPTHIRCVKSMNRSLRNFNCMKCEPSSHDQAHPSSDSQTTRGSSPARSSSDPPTTSSAHPATQSSQVYSPAGSASSNQSVRSARASNVPPHTISSDATTPVVPPRYDSTVPPTPSESAPSSSFAAPAPNYQARVCRKPYKCRPELPSV